MPIHDLTIITAVSLLGYLFGSLSSAIIVCKLFNLPDPRSKGSNNPGATNVLRIGGKRAAALTLLGDTLKGVIPLLLLQWLAPSFWGANALSNPLASNPTIQIASLLGFCGIGAVLGHLFPLFYHFRGGKGVATALGVVHVWSPMLGLTIDALWLSVAATTRYSSLASIASWLAALPISMLLVPQYTAFVLPITALLIYRHKSNIQKLIQGTESKIGSR